MKKQIKDKTECKKDKWTVQAKLVPPPLILPAIAG